MGFLRYSSIILAYFRYFKNSLLTLLFTRRRMAFRRSWSYGKVVTSRYLSDPSLWKRSDPVFYIRFFYSPIQRLRQKRRFIYGC